jgi:FtsH-binding integral membrane protein
MMMKESDTLNDQELRVYVKLLLLWVGIALVLLGGLAILGTVRGSDGAVPDAVISWGIFASIASVILVTWLSKKLARKIVKNREEKGWNWNIKTKKWEKPK